MKVVLREVGPQARCRCCHRSVSWGPLPHPACTSRCTGRSTCLDRWSAVGGGCRFRGPRGWHVAAAIAVAGHGDAGCAGVDVVLLRSSLSLTTNMHAEEYEAFIDVDHAGLLQ